MSRLAWVAAAVLGGCNFQHGTTSPPDVPVTPPDVLQVTWSVDATSHKGVPKTASEWSDLIKAYAISTTAPDDVWLMQETTGDLSDAVGATTLAALNGPSYGNVISGWTRTAVGTAETTINQGFYTHSIGNLDGTSYLLLLYVAVLAPPSTDRSVMSLGDNSDQRYLVVTSAPRLAAEGFGVTPQVGGMDPTTAVHPIAMEIDATHHRYVVFSDEEELAPAWVNTQGVGADVVVGNGNIGAAQVRYLYGALWRGTKAELADAEMKKLFQGLGWTVTGFER